MSDGTQNIGDEHAVVGEPASQPHQAVVVGEPPENVAPVLGEPAFANGLQDQEPISPPSLDRTSANGFQSTPHLPFLEEPSVSSSHVSAPSSAPPVEESPNLQQVESGTGESATHQLEAPVAENPVDEVLSASTDAETLVTPNTHDTEPAADIPDVVVAHIEDSPSEVPLPQSEVPTENTFEALDECQTDENVSVEPVADGATTANVSSTPHEISSKGVGDQQEEGPLSDLQEEHLASTQTNVDDGPLEVSKAVHGDVHSAGVGQGDALAQESDAKEANLEEEETGSSVVEHSQAPELDHASERDAFIQGSDGSEDIQEVSEAREISQSEVSPIEELSISQKDILNENHAAPIASNEETLVEAPLADSPVAPQGSRAIAAEECLVNQPHAEETYFPPAANGNNGYQHCEDGDRPLEREQDLPKDDDDASAVVEKPSSRIKLPLIFTGLAIAAVGVAVASISRTH